MLNTLRYGTCAAAALLLASCGDSADPGDASTVVDSAGIRIVQSTAPAEPGRFRIESEPLVRSGREEEGPYQFAFVGAGTLLDTGEIVVADAGAEELRVFDASGDHLTTLGGAGEGPGEFRSLSAVFDYPGDSIAAFDQRLYRTTIFSTRSGAPRTLDNEVEGHYNVFGIIGDGPFLLYSPGRSFHPDLPPGDQWVFTDIIAMDPADASSRVIATLPNQWRRVGPDGNAPMPQPLLFAIHAVGPNGFYWGTSDRYEIRLYDAEGNLEKILRRRVAPRPVEPAMIERFIERRLDQVRLYQGEEAVPRYRARLESEDYGDFLPLFRSAFVDGEGRLWVGSSEWPLDRPSRVWSVFSPKGYWLAHVRAPEGLRILDASGDRVLGIWQDSLDVPHVQLHRLVDASGER